MWVSYLSNAGICNSQINVKNALYNSIPVKTIDHFQKIRTFYLKHAEIFPFGLPRVMCQSQAIIHWSCFSHLLIMFTLEKINKKNFEAERGSADQPVRENYDVVLRQTTTYTTLTQRCVCSSHWVLHIIHVRRKKLFQSNFFVLLAQVQVILLWRESKGKTNTRWDVATHFFLLKLVFPIFKCAGTSEE